jgi:hypothetical protein
MSGSFAQPSHAMQIVKPVGGSSDAGASGDSHSMGFQLHDAVQSRLCEIET